MKFKSLYVAATSQHVGKTTSTLGLASVLKSRGMNIGYCKPVGQKFVLSDGLKVDKDVVLFADLLKFQMDPTLHSPVILGQGTTSEYLENPDKFNFRTNLISATHNLKRLHDLIIYEGTGHPGVGATVGLSNADVAKLTDSGLIMIAEGGIGNTIDMLSLCFEKFNRLEVPIIGVILNKVIADKRDRIEYFVKKWLDKKQIPLLGILPFDKTMGFPTLISVVESVKGRVEYNPEYLNNMVEGSIAGSLISSDELEGKGQHLLLVVGASRLDLAVDDTLSVMKQKGWNKPPFSGIISTGFGEYNRRTVDFIQSFKIPLIRTMLETFGAVVKIDRIEVKINLDTPWKVQRAVEMINANVDMDLILNRLQQ